MTNPFLAGDKVAFTDAAKAELELWPYDTERNFTVEAVRGDQVRLLEVTGNTGRVVHFSWLKPAD